MKIRIYQADKGDCLLLSGDDGGQILIDGGMRTSFQNHVRPDLGKLAASKQALDLVCVSHIDQDHISGVLELLDNVMAWRVHDWRVDQGTKLTAPVFPRMPRINAIWHNAFSDVLQENAGPVERLLAQSSLVLGLSSRSDLQRTAAAHHEIAYGVAEAVQVSQRISANQLNIPLNAEFGGKLIMTRTPAGRVARIAKMNVFVLGPLPSEVARVREEWDTWLRGNKERIRKLKKEAETDARGLGNSADRIADLLAARVDELGSRAKVTAPNLASVMLLVQEGRKSVLLTGDGHWEDIVLGLQHNKKLKAGGQLHLDVIKVPHHGSEFNYAGPMAERITAAHYVFCCNGKHDNPDTRIIQLICDSHRKVRPGDTFTLWFNCAPALAPAGKPRAYFQKIKKEVDAQVTAGAGSIRANFLEQSFFDLQV